MSAATSAELAISDLNNLFMRLFVLSKHAAKLRSGVSQHASTSLTCGVSRDDTVQVAGDRRRKAGFQEFQDCFRCTLRLLRLQPGLFRYLADQFIHHSLSPFLSGKCDSDSGRVEKVVSLS